MYVALFFENQWKKQVEVGPIEHTINGHRTIIEVFGMLNGRVPTVAIF